MSEPQNAMEREFVAIFEEGRRCLIETLGGVPPEQRREILRGIKIIHDATGDVICTMDDADYLERFRVAYAR